VLIPLFEPVTGPHAIVYTNGEEWEDRRKWLYGALSGKSLEGYMPIFVKVIVQKYLNLSINNHSTVEPLLTVIWLS